MNLKNNCSANECDHISNTNLYYFFGLKVLVINNKEEKGYNLPGTSIKTFFLYGSD